MLPRPFALFQIRVALSGHDPSDVELLQSSFSVDSTADKPAGENHCQGLGRMRPDCMEKSFVEGSDLALTSEVHLQLPRQLVMPQKPLLLGTNRCLEGKA